MELTKMSSSARRGLYQQRVAQFNRVDSNEAFNRLVSEVSQQAGPAYAERMRIHLRHVGVNEAFKRTLEEVFQQQPLVRRAKRR